MLRLQALQVSNNNLEAAVAVLRQAKKVTLENDLLCFVTLALGQLFQVLHGHTVCLRQVPEADLVALCSLRRTTLPVLSQLHCPCNRQLLIFCSRLDCALVVLRIRYVAAHTLVLCRSHT